MLRELDIHILKNEVRPLLYTLYKNELRMNQKHKYMAKTIKLLEESMGGKYPWPGLENVFIAMFLNHKRQKEKKDKFDFIKIKHFGAKNTKRVTRQHRMAENICKMLIQGLSIIYIFL